MTKLALRQCTPVKKGSKPISPGIARSLLNQINNKWRLDNQVKSVEREFEFVDFRQAIEFVNAISWIANSQDHHPNLEVNYNRCKIRFSTHAAGGLTVNDFICAAKIDALFNEENLKTTSTSPVKRQQTAAAATGGGHFTESKESAAEDSLQLNELSLDSKEVEELLNKKLYSDEEDEPTAQDTADEFELIDPETIKPPEPPRKPESKKEEQPVSAAAKENPAIVEDSHSELDLTSTVILPPGMQVVGKKPSDDEDEDATVILPENTAIDPEEAAAAKNKSAYNLNADSNLRSTPSPNFEDDDEVRTVILNSTLTAKTEEETVILPPVSPKTDADEVGTMILSSNPLNHPSKAAGTNKQESKSVGKDPENTTKSAIVEEESDYIGTMVMSSADMEAMKLEQPEKKKPEKKVDEDDTLVMHVNDFKKLKNDNH